MLRVIGGNDRIATELGDERIGRRIVAVGVAAHGQVEFDAWRWADLGEAQACVVASNYGEASAFLQLAAPGRLPPVISGHNNYFLWGPGTCTGQVLIGVGFSPSDFKATYADVALVVTARCQYCVSFEQDVAIVVASNPRSPINLARLWPTVKHYD